MKYAFDFLDAPMRAGKPREQGLTIVRDRMRPVETQRAFLNTYAPFVDFVKISNLSPRFYSENLLKEKLALYQEHGVTPFFGGIFFETAFSQDKLDPFFDYLTGMDISAIELSDNVIEIPEDVLFDAIGRCRALGLSVFVEWGEKYPSKLFDPQKAVDDITRRLDAGAARVVVERAELDVAFDSTVGEAGSDALRHLGDAIGLGPLVFEGEAQEQLVSLLKLFGPDVNLGPNVDFELVPWLEPARAGVGREIGHTNVTRSGDPGT